MQAWGLAMYDLQQDKGAMYWNVEHSIELIGFTKF